MRFWVQGLRFLQQNLVSLIHISPLRNKRPAQRSQTLCGSCRGSTWSRNWPGQVTNPELQTTASRSLKIPRQARNEFLLLKNSNSAKGRPNGPSDVYRLPPTWTLRTGYRPLQMPWIDSCLKPGVFGALWFSQSFFPLSTGSLSILRTPSLSLWSSPNLTILWERNYTRLALPFQTLDTWEISSLITRVGFLQYHALGTLSSSSNPAPFSRFSLSASTSYLGGFIT